MVEQKDSSDSIVHSLQDSVEWIQGYNQRIEDERQRYRAQPPKIYGASASPEQAVSQPTERGAEEGVDVADSLRTPQQIRDYHALNEQAQKGFSVILNNINECLKSKQAECGCYISFSSFSWKESK